MTRRNAETGRFESVPANDVATEPAYGYYSKVLNKPFDTLNELQDAELAVKKAEDEKKNAIVTRKADAEKVKVAITNRIEADLAAKKASAEAYKKYLAELDEIESKRRSAKEEETKALQEFCEKYKEGFHDTINVDDIQYRVDYSTSGNVSFTDPFTKMIDTFFRIF